MREMSAVTGVRLHFCRCGMKSIMERVIPVSGQEGERVMTKKNIRVKLQSGAEVRPIALLVQEASKYDSVIYIQAGGRRVNAKSIMGMMSLGLNTGLELEVSADGEDEKAAVDGIDCFLSGKGA